MLDMAEIQAELAHFHRDVEYGQAHYDELLEKYPEQWVAIYGEAVVGAGPDRRQLGDALRKQGIPPEHTYFEFFTHDDTVMII